MNIEERLLTINPYSRPGKKLNSHKYILIHYVGNPGSSALANRNYFNNLPKINEERIKQGLSPIYASSQYIIGLIGEKINCIPEDEVAYHAGNYTVNCNSIGIEVCHPDVTGVFSDTTKQSLKELVQDLVARYGIKEENIKRHYDITGKKCPLAYVNDVAWLELKSFLLDKNVDNEIKKEEFNMAKVYKNGSTRENVFAETNFRTKTGSLNPWEQVECLDVVNGAYLVKYKVDGTNTYKTGFCKYHGGVN